MKRDAFGLQRLYRAGERHGSTIRALLDADRTLDMIAVEAHLRGDLTPDRTMFAAVHQVPPSGPGATLPGSFGDNLRAAVTSAVKRAPRPIAVALSGGLDSAVILALARAVDPSIEAIVLAPEIASYSERETALATDPGARVIEVTQEELVAVIPDAIAGFETPLYNLHPVSKWLLARAARTEGVASVISGDGADQVFRHDTSADYLPLVGAAFDAHGVALHAPFLDIGAVALDPDKRAVRELAATLGIRDELVHGPKVSRLAPPIPFEAPVDRLADLLRRPLPELTDDRDRVRWGTLALLVDAFEAWT